MAAFFLSVVPALLYRELPAPPALTLGVTAVLFAIFVRLVLQHRALRLELRRVRTAESLARAGEFRLSRDWDGLQGALQQTGYEDALSSPAAAADERHPYVRDLDIFGPASVRALLGPVPTPTGIETLRAWLSAPASVAEIRRRQAAVRSLALDFEGRERLAIESLLVERVDREGWVSFLSWLSSPDEILPWWAIHVARIMPPITIALFASYVMVEAVPAWVFTVPLGVQTLLAWRWGLALRTWLDAASNRSRGVRRHHPLFLAWEGYASDEEGVLRLLARLGRRTGRRASSEIRSLEKWLDAADSRASMFHIVFAAVVFWDVHVAWGLARWRHRSGEHVRDWFEALGELEALSALATLAHDHPDWCWPELDEGEASFEADGLGHPLLSDHERRTSDVALDPPGRFLLVTGSNMSGKSTLLRSIGLAAVLAQAGSVVCARRAKLTPLRTFTSMRITDSLTGGVSLFMAELLRLKSLVDAADGVAERESGDPESAPPALLYLVDEVLQGTNSEERRVAARRIVRHLLAANAIGAVTTHDLSLHDDAALDPASTKVHFREQLNDDGRGDVLSFDYLLRQGLATSRNALKLLKIVGLDDGSDSGDLA